MRQKMAQLTLLLLISLMVALPAYAEGVVVDEATFKKIEANLICTDGCGMYLQACSNQTAQQMRTEIRQKLSEGMTPEQIYGFMINIYGEEVMAAPPPSVPFNITAWVTPFLAILGGGLVVYMALDKWVFYNKDTSNDLGVDESDMAEYEELLDEEIKKHY